VINSYSLSFAKSGFTPGTTYWDIATDETDVDKLESEVTTLSQSSVFNPFEYKVKIKLRSIRLNKKMYYHKDKKKGNSPINTIVDTTMKIQ
jgi:hypothetical protein